MGFLIKNTFKAFMIVYVTSVLSCLLTYFISKYIFKDFCLKKVFKKRIFQVIWQESQDHPWKSSILLRVMFVPVAYKNYAMALMHINFV